MEIRFPGSLLPYDLRTRLMIGMSNRYSIHKMNPVDMYS